MEVRIEKIVAGGDGLARSRGRVVFVPGTIPGERHVVEIMETKKDYARARSLEVLEPAPERREPPCPYFDRCGGCALMHLEPPAQLDVRRGILLEAFERNGLSLETPLQTVTSPELGYRIRLRFHVVLVGGEPILGFRRRGSHEVVDIDRCLLGTEGVNAAWGRMRRFFRKRPLLARHVSSVELSESSTESGRIVARFLVRSPDGVRRVEGSRGEALLEELGLEGAVLEVAKGGPLLRLGRTWVEHRVGRLALRQSAESFFQTNRFLLERLVEVALGGEDGTEIGRGLDLHCGVGLFSLPLAARAKSVLGVETSSMALADARFNAERAGIDNLRFRRDDAGRFVARGTLREEDVVIVDPPRGGLPRGLLEALGRSPLRRLRYVSCDPPALARDASTLARYGFRVDSLVLVDLFPNTHLFETVALLSRERRPKEALANPTTGGSY